MKHLVTGLLLSAALAMPALAADVATVVRADRSGRLVRTAPAGARPTADSPADLVAMIDRMADVEQQADRAGGGWMGQGIRRCIHGAQVCWISVRLSCRSAKRRQRRIPQCESERPSGIVM